MATVTLPTIEAKGYDLEIIRRDSALEMIGDAEVYLQPPWARWVLSLPLEMHSEADNTKTRQWRSRLAQMVKLGNNFNVTPPGYSGPGTGYGGADPLVKGASQTGTSLNCDGVTISTAILLEGDYFSVNGEFKIATADATSNGAGDVTLAFEPALRASPADNATVEIQSPVIKMRLLEPRAGWRVDPNLWHFFKNIAAIEVPA